MALESPALAIIISSFFNKQTIAVHPASDPY